MLYCPYCGIKVQTNEKYCLKCGKEIPQDLEIRMETQKAFNRLWLIPIGIITLFICTSIIYYFVLQNQIKQAEQLYEQGEEELLNERYERAESFFKDALQMKANFKQADIALQFVKKALDIQQDIKTANFKLHDQDYQTALSLINKAEHELNNYNGQATTELIDRLTAEREQIKLEILQSELEKNPTIDDLKILLWDAEEIDTAEAQDIMTEIRNQIVDYTYSKAVEQLNKHQFSDAQLLIDDGLEYAQNSEKLLSLQTTIEKEQNAFETAQEERIEQAIDLAEEEQEINESDAIELEDTTVKKDDQGRLVVEGEVQSVATVPINSVLVEYSINDLDKELVTNNVFVFPDTLYPNENGEFEFTHYDVDEKVENIDIQINKITWYTE